MSVLVRDNVKRTLVNMAFPMLAGTFAMNAYSLTDAYFVSRLGTLPLAAMGFTVPVIMLLTFIAGGIGTGITTLVSHAMGRHDHTGAARTTTHGIVLTFIITAILTTAGYLTMVPLFTKLGADARTLPLISQFMRIWYIGAIFMSLPMTGNGILISAGDSRTASRFMIVGAAVNMALNPVMIFGLLGFPALGIRGSALATVVAQVFQTAWLFFVLRRKHHLLVFEAWPVAEYVATFRRILKLGIPSVLSMILMPISAGVITRLLGGFGSEAVAASGAAGRLEMFAFVIPMALGMSLTPFISQNFGAGRMDRISEAFGVSTRFALLYGGGVALVFFLCAPWMARLFSSDPAVTDVMVSYVRIISFGYGMMEVHRYCGFILTGLHKAASATVLNVIRVFVLLVPLSVLGMHLGGVKGIFWGRLITDLVAGTLGIAWVHFIAAVRWKTRPTLR